MLSAFFFFVLLQVLAIDANNVSFDLSAASLVLDPGWVTSSTSASGKFITTSSIGQALTITLPGSTSSVNYVGLKRTEGSIYGVCVDCDSGTTNSLQLVSGTDSTLLNNADAEPTTIFSFDVDPSQQHTLQITNVGNNSLDGEGEITFISVVAIDQEASSTVFITASVSSSSTFTTPTSTPTTTTTTSTSVVSASLTGASTTGTSTTSTVSSSGTASAAPATSSITGSSQTRTSLIALIVVLSLIAVSSLGVGLFFYLRKQRGSGRDPSFATENPPTTEKAPEASLTLASSGFLAKAGRQKPPTRLLEPYPYQFGVPQNGSPIFPARRLETTG
ncbi:hypothetical protein BDP27DRAFT_1318018 [Rhodocollybia butyracea]|uniref:Uncharacterized protein n=1 Tax=Rhodocollybia butyracea TaxID=206335 RepID=A0A9P5Q284_9AGAR|nr:hypothetical protein BDP27DRAFT_1318018 [Rhodocollybia butyracea]